MTDMRSTERLLQVIQENAEVLFVSAGSSDARAKLATAIVDAVTELNLRGDTIVRRNDLRLALQDLDPIYVNPERDAAVERLEIALGGKLR